MEWWCRKGFGVKTPAEDCTSCLGYVTILDELTFAIGSKFFNFASALFSCFFYSSSPDSSLRQSHFYQAPKYYLPCRSSVNVFCQKLALPPYLLAKAAPLTDLLFTNSRSRIESLLFDRHIQKLGFEDCILLQSCHVVNNL